jgi:FixJ family two-component response regulator
MIDPQYEDEQVVKAIQRMRSLTAKQMIAFLAIIFDRVGIKAVAQALDLAERTGKEK